MNRIQRPYGMDLQESFYPLTNTPSEFHLFKELLIFLEMPQGC